MSLVYVTWNLLGGGLDAGLDSRLRRQMAALAELHPTVVALQECTYWDRDYFRIFHRAEQYLGLRGYLSPSSHHGCHLAIFIREGTGLRVAEQRHERGHPYWHGVARVVVAAGGYRSRCTWPALTWPRRPRRFGSPRPRHSACSPATAR